MNSIGPQSAGSSHPKFSLMRVLRGHRHGRQSLVELSESPEPLVLSARETQKAHGLDAKARSSKRRTAPKLGCLR